MKVLLNKIASSTRNCRLSREVTLGSQIIAEEGSVLAVRALDRKSTYNEVEDIHGRMATVNEGDIVAGVLAHPDWRAATFAMVTRPEGTDVINNYGYIYMLVGLVGTTIAPWMQFYLQASVVEKGVTIRQYSASRWDVIVGCLFAAIVAWFIIVACAATLHTAGVTHITFAAGLFNASLFAASILPISTAYAVCEGLGFESGLDKKFHEAPVFYWLYTVLIVAGAGVLLVPNFPLPHIMVLSQVVNGVVLPFVLIFMLLLTNDRELMGTHVNSLLFNVIAWVTVVAMIGLTIAMLVTQG